ncbi:DUF2023 family protein [Beijerinckia mobilis]|uniref:DUF2023 family protein n=1 Tax=Beijerinckia mobilis TaxID=231434 RepID=UPI000A873011|nr:DUF2023 family protein [Beijerinckia mobilis]
MAEPIALIEEAQWPLSPATSRSPDALPILRLFHHHIYEYSRGVRSLFLMTITRPELAFVLAKLEAQGIPHFVQEVNPGKVNLFFGRPAFVAVARSFVTRPLNTLSVEEDFMLGMLLGYDREQQCLRFLVRSGRGLPEDLPLAAE